MSTTVQPGPITPVGFQQLATLSSALGLTPVISLALQPNKFVVLSADTNAIRWRDDGTAPTATIGMRLVPGVDLVYTGDLTTIKFIEETATSNLNISYYV